MPSGGDGSGNGAVWVRDFLTRDPEAGHAFLDTYTPQRPRMFGDPRGFRLAAHQARVGPIALDTLRHSMRVRTQAAPFLEFAAPQVHRGSLHVSAAGRQATAGPGQVLVYPPGAELDVSWSAGIEVSLLRLPLDHLAAAATATGIAAADFRIEGLAAVSPGRARYWRRLLAWLSRELHAGDATVAEPLVLAETTRMLAVAAISVFPNTTLTTAHLPGPGRIAPAALRRAIEFCEAHAAEAITVDEIAKVAGTSIRALQHAFAQHYDTTPMRYLRQVRLQRAHQALQAADAASGATVASIAAAWGFPKPSRFAQHYRRAYGVPPSHTLRT